MASRDQALSLLSAASNHNDLAVKLSSLRQAKDILLAVEPSLAADLFPYLAALQSCPEPLVRKMLLEIIQEIGLRAMEHSSELIPVLLTFMGDSDPFIARQSIVSGTHFFFAVVEEMAFQFHRRGKVEWWLKELWRLMLRFKDAVFTIALEPGSVGMKLQALKFLETYVLLFTDDTNDSEKFFTEGSRRLFNISCLVDGHPVLDPVALTSDANNTLFILLGSLRSPGSLPGVLTIAVVNCLAAIARKRPIHYDTVVSALLDFEQKIDMMKGCHIASIQYCIRTALLGFLRCINPAILESRDRLLRALRLMNAGDAADQVIRQVDKMIKNNERASRDARFGKEDPLSSQLPAGDQLRKRTVPLDVEEPANGHEVAVKHFRYSPNMSSTMAIQINDSEQDSTSINGVLTNAPQLDGDMTPAEQMIAMIGALLAEGERGAESLEILISNIHPDLLADIVITNMKHLPKVSPPLTRVGNSSVTYQIGSLNSPTKVLVPSGPINPIPPAPPAQQPFSTATANTSSLSDGMTVNNFATDPKRDPRRDPRRLDPRRTTTPIGLPSVVTDDSGALQLEFDSFASLSKPVSLPATTTPENPPAPFVPNCKSIDQTTESPLDSEIDRATLKEESLSRPEEIVPPFEINTSSDNTLSPIQTVDEDSAPPKLSDDEVIHDADTSSVIESDEDNLAPSNTYVAEETLLDLPQLPEYVELTEEQQRTVSKLAVERIIDLYSHGTGANCCQTRMALLGRLVAQSDTHDDIVAMLQKHIVLDYRMQKGHEVVMHILYHLHSLMILDSGGSSSHAVVYEKFLLVMAKSLLDAFPASDKSLSKLLGEVPLLPEAALKLLDDLCYCDVYDSSGKEIRDGERVTQGLGAVWSLILGRPNHRQVCLDIALKCAVHAQDDIRGKAIRLVANKLYHLDYISENIEQYATKMLLSAVDQHTSDIKALQSVSSNQREEEVGSQEASINSSHATETEISGNGPIEGVQPVVQSGLATSFAEAQRLTSLYFALCTKKPSLLQLVFDIYGCAPKTVKQAVHRNMPTLISTLGSSYSELLRIISDPPEGCENLLMLVLQILTQEMTPSADLIATVKHLHETKLKDATILIPILSSLSKMEVLPIFPRLVSLPLEKFQMALAHILQGSAHTGPALTPAEVLVAIHDISPEKDGLALKKITDACSACFEQRTIFTQQVFAKALNQMVDQTPLPLLFMRTVIQAVNAFPPMVGFVMEILSKLVSRQVWTMPKLWFGFLKCVSQTWPHSYDVLAQLPPPQLESVFQRHGNLKKAMVNHVNDNGLSLPRSTLAVLGLANELLTQQPHVSTLHPPETSPSVHRASLT